MAVEYCEVRYRNYGRCLKIENAFIETIVTLDVGPRVIRYAVKGGENVMHEDRARKLKKDDKVMSDYYGRGACWYIYGGHRIWAAPEYLPETYYPDNNRVEYSVTGRTFTFTPPPQKKNDLQMTLKLSFDEYSGKIKVENIVQNIGSETKVFAVWALSVLAPGGIELVPQSNNPTGLLHNRHMSFWDYTDMGDRRVAWSREYFMLKQDKRREQAFKVGTDNKRGWAAYINHGCMFLKEFDYLENARYPDDGCNFETYTSDKFLEMESLSPLASVEPGKSVSHIERWDIIDDMKNLRLGDFGAAEDIVRKYIGK